MQGNEWDFSKRMLELDMEKMCVLAESHWDKVDGIVFSGVRCYLVEAGFFSVIETGKVSMQEINKKGQVKMCAECKRAEQSQWEQITIAVRFSS